MADKKRRFVQQLPAVLQTETNQKFFGATVDHLFQPGKSEPISGYIGQYPSYFDAAKDFYIAEPSDERSTYQLEPAMVSVSNTDSTAISRILFYPDLVNYLRSSGANVSNHSRLFEGDYYSWCPPVDLDKLNNPHNYYWFGDAPTAIPAVALLSTPLHAVGDGVQTSFGLPPAISAFTSADEDVVVFVDGSATTAFTRTGDNVVFTNPPTAGANLELYRYGDIAKTINGKTTYDPSPFTSAVTALTTSMRVTITDGRHRGGVSYIVAGVGQSILLTTYAVQTDTSKNYIVMDRRARDQNPWSQANFWVHRDAFSWSGNTFPDRIATRPIIEFLPNLELWHYGRNRLTAVQGVATSKPKRVSDSTIISVADINGMLPGSVKVDGNYVIQVGDRILISQDVEDHAEISNTIVTVITTTNDEDQTVFALAVEDSVADGDVVLNVHTGIDYYFDGAIWALAQTYSVNDPPLFTLYVGDGHRLDSETVYPKSTFAGSRLFGFAEGTGTDDAVLGIPLVYDSLGQITFENDLSSRPYTYGIDTEITGFYYFKYLAVDNTQDTLSNNWYLAASPSSQVVIGDGLYSIPTNLQANPDNERPKFITRNQWFDHFNSIMTGQSTFAGAPYSTNNWRDTAQDRSKGQFILQHRSPMLKLMLLASDLSFDVIESTQYVDHEYTRFRNRFVQKTQEFLLNGTLKATDSVTNWVQAVLDGLKVNKTSEFPFALNTVAGGQYFIPPTAATLGLIQPVTPAFVTRDTYGPTPITLLRGHDGSLSPLYGEVATFEGDGATQSFVLTYDPTGTVTAKVNGTTVSCSVGGKIITLASAPALGATVVITVTDIRDSVLLGLETRIYQNIASTFKSELFPGIDFHGFVSGKFRDTGVNGYSREEVAAMTVPFFLRWAQNNQLDFRANTGFDQSNPFTWNYSQSVDRNGDSLPGHWRGIYRWFFDTEHPHLTPWEMLGFSEAPSWWQTRYGAAPYTRGNTALWADIAAGRIQQGARAGTDPRFARPNLLSILPVDDNGELLDPMGAGIVAAAPTVQMANRPWEIGDCAPIESAWMNSTSYAFTKTILGFLMKPARWVEQNWDTLKIVEIHNDQWVYSDSNDRPRHANIYVHGEIPPGATTKQTITGVQQWVCERMISRGVSPSTLGTAIRGVGTQLAHKMAGFTSTSNLRVVADNFGLVPSENVQAVMYTSPSLREEFYSGVLIEWTGSTWRVVGYNALDPTFSIIPSDVMGPRVSVALDTAPVPVIVPWRPNVSYQAGTLAQHGNSVYKANRTHLSTTTFEQSFWTAQPGIAPQHRIAVTKYLKGSDTVVAVPYGTEFSTPQDVADFLFGYERWLISRGWIFDELDQDSQTARDWTAATRDFLSWSQISWQPGNFITLSPSADKVKFSTEQGLIFSLEQSTRGSYGIVDRAGMPIDRRNTFVNRLDGNVEITAMNGGIYGIRLRIGESEHALVFSNNTIFNDVIYTPLLNLRQPRLRLTGERTTQWTGRLDAPGFMLIDNNIAPNFDSAAENFRTMYDIEGTGNSDFKDHARHLIGYESRSYLSNMLLSEVEQFEFYQGMIHQKGAPGVFNKMLRSDVIGQNRDLRFLDEWAFKVAEYGAVGVTSRTAFNVFQSDVRRNPQYVRFADTDANTDTVCVTSSRFVIGNNSVRFPQRTGLEKFIDLPTAGYVRIDEVDYTAFFMSDIAGLYNGLVNKSQTLAVGDAIWVYMNDVSTWDVLLVYNLSTANSENTLGWAEPSPTTLGATRIFPANSHGLTSGDVGKYIIIDGEARTQSEIEGVHKILAVNTDWIEVDVGCQFGYVWDSGMITGGGDGSGLPTATDPQNAPKLKILRSVRFAALTDVTAATWLHPVDHDLVYVDQTPHQGWIVRRYLSGAWSTWRVQPLKMDPRAIKSACIFDLNTKIAGQDMFIEPLLLDHLLVYDPIAACIPGQADGEISYKLEYDPAAYNQGAEASDDAWSPDHVGQLWWDLSTVRFLNVYTDNTGTDDRGQREVNYRIANWGGLAPGSSVDIYEWTRSTAPPSEWTGKGVIYNSDLPSWVETEEFDPRLGRLVTIYYFWVKGADGIQQGAKDRSLDASTVARMIESPTALDIPWIAPIAPDAFLISGVSHYLNDSSSVVQVTIRPSDYDGVTHTEWSLVRPNDDNSTIPPIIWNKLIDSLVGYDRLKTPVPDPALHEAGRQGILSAPRQSLFGGVGDIRGNVLKARESFVLMVNTILARNSVVYDRTNVAANLTRSSVVRPFLLWTSESTDGFQAPPTSTEWDFEVFNAADKLALISTSDFSGSSEKLRILLNRLGAPIPTWSVWDFDPKRVVESGFDNGGFDIGGFDLPAVQQDEDLYSLARTYDFTVSTLSDRDVLIERGAITTGERVLVQHDDNADGFWTLWQYDPTNQQANSKGFVLLRAQEYRLADFWDYADWYADGYSASLPPVVHYGTFSERNIAEAPTPSSTFVRIDDDGTGKWVWTAYTEISPGSFGWQVVARQQGTIQISDKFYDATGPVYGVSDYVLSNIVKRDGSNELRILVDALTEVLTAREVNELFFSLIHFAHANQDQVNWAFKTSFLNVAGYNERLSQAAIQVADNTNNLIAYIDEVKPYRVKTRTFTRGLSPDDDVMNASSTDFDKPRYFDPVNNTYRSLNLTFAADAAILATGAWKSWNDNYQKTGHDINTPSTFNPIRSMTTTLTFDRIDGVFGLTDGAAGRITNYYSPTDTMAEKSIESLMKLGFKGKTIADGEGLNTTIGNTDVIMDGNEAGHPAYLVNPNDDNGLPGLNLNDPRYAENRPEEMAVTRAADGVVFTVSAYGTPGGPRQSTNHYKNTSTASTATFDYSEFAQSNAGVVVFRDGVRAKELVDYTIDHFQRQVTVNMIVNGQPVIDVCVHVFGFGGTQPIISVILARATAGQTLFHSISVPGSLEETYVNGTLVSSTYNSTDGSVTLASAASAGDEVTMVHRRDDGSHADTGIRLQTEYPPYSSAGTYTLTTVPTGDQTNQTIVEVNGLRLVPGEQYTVVDTVLQIATDKLVGFDVDPFDAAGFDADAAADSSLIPGPSDVIRVTSFTHNTALNIVTDVFSGKDNGLYKCSWAVPSSFVITPYLWVTFDGKHLTPDVDFAVRGNSLYFASGHLNTSRLIVTAFTANPVRSARKFIVSSINPSRDMTPETMEECWEYSTATGPRTGYLVADMEQDTKTIDVQLPPNAVAFPKFYGTPGFVLPQPDAPGTIWINGERIEYSNMTVSNNVATLSGLVRGTHGTRVGQESRLLNSYPGNGTTTTFNLNPVTLANGNVINVTTVNGIQVVVANTDGTAAPVIDGLDYSIALSNGAAVITFNTAPVAGKTIFISQTVDNSVHQAGSAVMNISETFKVGNVAL